MPHLVLRRSPAIEDQQILEEGFLVGENKGVSLKQNCLNSLSRSVLLERILPRIIWRRTLSLVPNLDQTSTKRRGDGWWSVSNLLIWRARRDLNSRPSAPEADALSN